MWNWGVFGVKLRNFGCWKGLVFVWNPIVELMGSVWNLRVLNPKLLAIFKFFYFDKNSNDQAQPPSTRIIVWLLQLGDKLARSIPSFSISWPWLWCLAWKFQVFFWIFQLKNFHIKRQQILKFTWEMDFEGFWIWNWTFDNMASADVPATLRYITGRKINYVGHRKGSEKPA